jgi:hypothetical protein
MGQSHGFDTQEQSCGEFKSWEDAASAWNKRNATMYYLKENLANLKSIEDLLIGKKTQERGSPPLIRRLR